MSENFKKIQIEGGYLIQFVGNSDELLLMGGNIIRNTTILMLLSSYLLLLSLDKPRFKR